MAIAVLAALATLWFGMRSYRTFLLLRSAYELGVPQASTLRAWMTLRYISATYHIPAEHLHARLGLPDASSPDLSLRTIAERQGKSPFEYVQQVQRSMAEIAPPVSGVAQRTSSGGWLAWFNDRILSALLAYGYAILALTLLLGAIGLPLPTGLAAAVAGSLTAAGRLNWLAAGLLAIAASVAGDVIAYGIGRGVSEQFLGRRGRWLGYTAARQAHAEALFARWGALTVLVTRTLVSHLSSMVSLLAGISRYRLAAFLSLALLGRTLWTFAYMGLGYSIGGSFEYATDFLKNISGMLVSASVFSIVIMMMSGLIRIGIGREDAG